MITLEQLMKRRAEVVGNHQEAVATVEQTRGAISILNELILGLQAEANGGGIDNDVEATDRPERQLSS